jgi:hypothetical protein
LELAWLLGLRGLIREAGPVAERVRVCEVDDDEGKRLVRIVRRGTGSAVTWRRAQMVLLPSQSRVMNRNVEDLQLRRIVDRANVA